MGESRRLRTDAERAQDAWRAAADSRPGFVTYPGTAGDPSWWRRCGHVAPECSTSHPRIHADCDGCTCPCHTARRTVVLRDFGPAYGDKAGPGTSAEVTPPPVDGETCAKWCGYCHLGSEPARVEEIRSAIAESAETGEPVLLADGSAMITAPRRRWWHRLTRRNP